jgi:uncharacterized membrane protein
MGSIQGVQVVNAKRTSSLGLGCVGSYAENVLVLANIEVVSTDMWRIQVDFRGR